MAHRDSSPLVWVGRCRGDRRARRQRQCVTWRRVQRLAESRSRLAPSRRRNSRALASHVAGRRRRRAGATAAPWRSLRVGVWLLTEASSFFLSVSSSSLILLADARRPRTAGHQRSVISTGLLGQIQILI